MAVWTSVLNGAILWRLASQRSFESTTCLVMPALLGALCFVAGFPPVAARMGLVIMALSTLAVYGVMLT